MTPEEYEEAASYWIRKDATSKAMPADDARTLVDAFLASHNTCALATGAGDFVRCTPLEYAWHDGAVWILSEGGLKFRALASNHKVCLAVYEPYSSMGQTHGLQVMGTAEVIDESDPAYTSELATKGVTPERLAALGMSIHLLRITPQSCDLLDSDLRKRGFDARQHLDL